MKERPILFSGAMVRAILDGRKTQTRRVAKEFDGLNVDKVLAHFPKQRGCPYGQPGDRLWGRETWGFNPDFPGMHSRGCFRADSGHEYDGIRRRPSIHMPRAACRLVLEITGVRVERLNDCSEPDAQAEGCAPLWLDADDNTTVHAAAPPTYRQAFARLWRDINGPGAWEQNPWVWVVEFRRK